LWKSIRSKFTVARQLTWRDWLYLSEAWWALLGFSLALRRLSLERLQRSFRLRGGGHVEDSATLAFAQRLQKLVSIASHYHLPSMTCLVRACTLHWMLSRRGIPSRLCIGVNRSPAGIQAHAWVDVLGQAIGEAEDLEEVFTILKPAIPVKS
jgi:hypothetical protein